MEMLFAHSLTYWTDRMRSHYSAPNYGQLEKLSVIPSLSFPRWMIPDATAIADREAQAFDLFVPLVLGRTASVLFYFGTLLPCRQLFQPEACRPERRPSSASHRQRSTGGSDHPSLLGECSKFRWCESSSFLGSLPIEHRGLTQTLSISKSAPVPFKIPRALPLSRVLSAFISHVSSKLSPSSTPSVSASSTTSSSSSSKARKAASLATPSPSAATISSNTATHNTPDFILTHPSAPNFLPLSPALTVDEAHLDEGDVLLAIEIMDLTSLFFPEASSSSAVLDGAVSTASTLTAPTTPSSKTSKRAQSSAGRKREAAAAAASAVPAVPSTPLSSADSSLAAAHEWARTLISNTMETAVRERLKGVLKQYEARERQFEAVLRSKELEILLAKARSEEAKLRADEAHLDAEQWEAEVSLLPYCLSSSLLF